MKIEYRNIKGFYYKYCTSNIDEFEKQKLECKKIGLRYRIIKNDFYKQIRISS